MAVRGGDKTYRFLVQFASSIPVARSVTGDKFEATKSDTFHTCDKKSLIITVLRPSFGVV